MSHRKQSKDTTNNDSFFVEVPVDAFRRRLNATPGCEIRRKGFETVVFDSEGDILGIVHAASIDETGAVHPTRYHLRRTEPGVAVSQLVA